MNNNQPLVSIVAACYNFERFIPYFIDSVLKQTYPNWELIITDDCSTDKSREVLRRYEEQDIRIKVFQNERNSHTSYTVNNSLKKACGKYVCIMSCDDALLPGKLAFDVSYMEQHSSVSVLYGQLQQIDENNTSSKYSYIPPAIFDRDVLLRDMFLEGNKCVSPGMFMRKDIVDAVGYFHPLLRMTHDYDYHVRVLFKGIPAFNPIPLTQYRRMSDNTNLSSTNDERTVNSECNETVLILENYERHIKEYKDLKAIFPEAGEFGPPDDRLIPYYLGRLALTSQHSFIQAFGINRVVHFMLEGDNSDYVERRTGFTLKECMYIMSCFHLYHSSKYPVKYSFIRMIWKRLYRTSRFLFMQFRRLLQR